MKLSYLISSIHGEQAIATVVKDIYALPKHDFEIVVCAPYPIRDSRLQYVHDDKANGSVYAYNKAYLASKGECIVICTDENHIPINFLETIDFLESPVVQKLKLKIANLTYAMGGPGKNYYIKNDKTKQPAENILWSLNHVVPNGHPNRRPFNVFHYAAIMRESIEKYMENKPLNESFIHHYPDHWLGFFEEMINGERYCGDLGPKNVFFEVIQEINMQKCNNEFDEKDKNTFLDLIRISNLETTSYNTKV